MEIHYKTPAPLPDTALAAFRVVTNWPGAYSLPNQMEKQTDLQYFLSANDTYCQTLCSDSDIE
jgi:hypothetical protein